MKPSTDDGSWIRDEMISADFGDIRLNKRFSTLARELAGKPSLSINEASTDWASAKASYRFFDNPKVNQSEASGLHLHATLALTEKGLPLGLLDYQMWSRSRQKAKGHVHVKIPIEQKESFRWIKSLRTSVQRTPKSKLIVVCDREADIYDLFEEALDLGAELVVRLQHDRIVIDEADPS